MRNEGEHFRTGVQELDKFPQGAEGFDPASAPLGAGASRRIEPRKALARRLLFIARTSRAAWLNSFAEKALPRAETHPSAAKAGLILQFLRHS